MSIQYQAFGVMDGYPSTVYAIRDTEADAIKDAHAALGTHAETEVYRRTQTPENPIELERLHTFTAADLKNAGDDAA